MPSINMIAPRRAEKKRLETNVRRLVLVILVEIVLTVSIAGILASRTYSTRSMVKGLEVQITKLQPTVHKIEYYDKAIQDLGPKVEILNGAKSDTMRWCRVLDDLSLSLPEKTWLTRLSTGPAQQAEEGLKLTLNGVSVNQNMVGEAMLRINDTVSDFSDLDLHYTQKTFVGLQQAVEFEIQASIELPKDNDSNGEEVQKS